MEEEAEWTRVGRATCSLARILAHSSTAVLEEEEEEEAVDSAFT